MMTRKAYILIEECVPGQAVEMARTIWDKPGVLAADVVTGPMDIIATVHASDSEAVARMVLVDLVSIPGVITANTCGVLPLPKRNVENRMASSSSVGHPDDDSQKGRM